MIHRGRGILGRQTCDLQRHDDGMHTQAAKVTGRAESRGRTQIWLSMLCPWHKGVQKKG